MGGGRGRDGAELCEWRGTRAQVDCVDSAADKPRCAGKPLCAGQGVHSTHAAASAQEGGPTISSPSRG